MSFNPTGFFKSTRVKEYDSYLQGIEDVMDLLQDEGKLSIELRDLILNIVVEAADDFVS